MKCLEKKVEESCTRMLRAVLNKSWKQHPTRKQLYGNLPPPILQTIRVRRTMHARHCWRSKDELISDVLLWKRTHGMLVWATQQGPTLANYVRILVAAQKTSHGQ